MKLTLNTDGRYTLSRLYQDRQSKPELVSGRFHWLPGDGAIALEGDDSRWQLGENQLSMLDTEGKVITGPLAHHYILRRTAH
ncbi:lipoprotein [Bordetella holmesii ATCC 51541]|nr:lipoprotein [Bordetella holmesii ATCC 51541]